MWKDITIDGNSYHVLIEDGYIKRGTITKNGDIIPAYVYRRRDGFWTIENVISVSAFRSGIRRGTIILN